MSEFGYGFPDSQLPMPQPPENEAVASSPTTEPEPGQDPSERVSLAELADRHETEGLPPLIQRILTANESAETAALRSRRQRAAASGAQPGEKVEGLGGESEGKENGVITTIEPPSDYL